MSLKCSHTESSNCCILLYESIRSSRIVTYVHVSVLERCENLKQMSFWVEKEVITDAKITRLACDSAVERFENIVEGPSL